MPYWEPATKRWRAVVRWKGERKTRKFRRKKDALKWEIETRKSLKAGKKSQDDTDLITFCGKYLDEARYLSPKTYDEKRTLCKRILEAWGPEMPVSKITPRMVLKYLNERAESQSTNAYNKDRKNLLVMWNWGRDFLGVESNPMLKIKRKPWDRRPQDIPTPEDVLRILSVATREERAFLYCYLLTGARRSEIFRWRWAEDINFEARRYRLGTRKNKDGSMQYEWFPMSDLLHDELKWWYENRPVKNSPYVFVSTWPRYYGRPFTTRRRFMPGLCKRAGVKQIGFHSLRHFFATLLADEHKQSPKTVQRLLRHSNLVTTERYIRNLNRDLKEVLDKVGNSLRGDDFEKKRHLSETPERRQGL